MVKEIIAVFDFDGTLFRYDSFLKFAFFSVGRARTFLALALNAPSLLLWKLRMRSADKAKECLFSSLYKGVDSSGLFDSGERFAKVIQKGLNEGVMREFRRHLAEGHRVVIATASLDFWVRPWAKMHGVECVLATEAERDEEGRLTGRFSIPNCRGKEKVRRLREAAPKRRSYDLLAYSDSESDYPLLAESDHAFMVKGGRLIPFEFAAPD